MSKPRFGWWGYAKWMCRVYPEHLQTLKELRTQRTVRAYDSVCVHGGGNTRQTEETALRELHGASRREFEAVDNAIKATHSQHRDGGERLRLVEMVFFKQSHSLEGAALACHVSYATAKNWQHDFLMQVGECFGLL